MNLPAWAREPLVHFLVGGVAIFAVFAWIGQPVDPASREITVSREQQAQIALQFQRTMQRPPTDAELDRLVERWVRQEVLYREALRLGLDQDDAVLRQRLAQKMEALASNRTELADPGDAVLQAWLEDNPQRFLPEYRVSFQQAWFESEADALAALDSEVEPQGGEISLPRSVDALPKAQVEARFGRQFAEELTALAADGAWQGPIPSGFGWHAVRLTARDTDAAELEPIRTRVLDDWRFRTGADRRDDAYGVLREAYTVTLEE